MPKSFNSRPKGLSMTSLIMILYALIMHDDHAINQIEVLKKKKKKKKKKKRFSDLPTLIFWGM